jgi:hypothetical protein
MIISKIQQISSYSKNNSDTHGEVFTPFPLINEMLDSLPQEIFKDPTKTFYDPTAGKGNMPAVIVERLMNGLKEIFPDETARYKHIMEKQIYMAEYQRESAEDIEKIFNPDGKLKLNLYVGDSLKIPEDFWDLKFEKRIKKYPAHYVFGKPQKVNWLDDFL